MSQSSGALYRSRAARVISRVAGHLAGTDEVLMRFSKSLTTGALIMSLTAIAAEPVTSPAFLEITLKVAPRNRAAAAEVYKRYKSPFLTKVAGARTKQLLVRDDDVQVLHGFDSVQSAEAYLKSALFNDDVVKALAPLLDSAPEVRVYTAN
jgi:hypothetical protein